MFERYRNSIVALQTCIANKLMLEIFVDENIPVC